jgi:hypothetical protein
MSRVVLIETSPDPVAAGCDASSRMERFLIPATSDMGDGAAQWAVPLDALSGVAWSRGVQVDALLPLDSLVVRTRNSCYEITIVAPASGDVLIRGGRFFPEPTRAIVSGSTLGGSCLKVRGIYEGFLLEILHDGQTIVTTNVQSVSKTDHASVH